MQIQLSIVYCRGGGKWAGRLRQCYLGGKEGENTIQERTISSQIQKRGKQQERSRWWGKVQIQRSLSSLEKFTSNEVPISPLTEMIKA